jgi:serpin B
MLLWELCPLPVRLIVLTSGRAAGRVSVRAVCRMKITPQLERERVSVFTQILALASVATLAVVLDSTNASASQPLLNPVVVANSQFAVDLYRELAKESQDKNLFFSPTSISVALAMTAAGGRSQTEAEMTQVLHLTGILPQAHAEYHKLLDRWNADGKDRGYQLRVANRLWGQKGFHFLPAYLDLTQGQYGAELGVVDFGQSETARKEINAWVEKQTANKIQDLIPTGALDALTRLVLTNAIYFKGAWANPFKKEQTRDEDFALSGGRKVKTPLMHQTQTYRYAEDNTLQALELPYKGNELAMLVLLPKMPDGLAALEQSLSAQQIVDLRAKLRPQKVNAYLPRFKLETSFALKGTLTALGMKTPFSPAADFSGMDGEKDLYLSAVIHKAFVDVNEEGTEAAAATGAIMALRSARIERPPVEFRADHPFVFMICDKRDGGILFLGRMTNPTAMKNGGARQAASKIKAGEVSWDDLKAVIRQGTVQSVMQEHSRRVTVTMADGQTYRTTEPVIDEIIKFLRETGKSPPAIATE